MFRNLCMGLMVIMALSACQSQSRIQSKYIAQQDECRSMASSLSPLPGEAPEVVNARVVTRFSECMNKAGWHVAAPKTPGTPVAQVPPGVLPSPNNPIVGAAAARAPAPVQATPPATGAAPVAAPAIGPGVTPNPPPATYQPGRPTSTQTAPYGSGAGRSF